MLRRAHALLDLAKGDSVHQVAQRYCVDRSTVYNWIRRVRSGGLNEIALRDRPRPGRPPTGRPAKEARKR